MNSLDAVAMPLAGKVLQPAGAGSVLVEWTAEGSETERLYQAPLHRHLQDDESWYVIEGSLRFRVGDGEVEAGAGGAVTVPPGLAHTYWNPSSTPARYLLIMTSRIYSLIEALHSGEQRSPEQMRLLWAEHGAELLE